MIKVDFVDHVRMTTRTRSPGYAKGAQDLFFFILPFPHQSQWDLSQVSSETPTPFLPRRRRSHKIQK